VLSRLQLHAMSKTLADFQSLPNISAGGISKGLHPHDVCPSWVFSTVKQWQIKKFLRKGPRRPEGPKFEARKCQKLRAGGPRLEEFWGSGSESVPIS